MRDNYLKITAHQIKAARALLGWSQDDLAEASQLSVATIRKIELGTISPRNSTNFQIQRAFGNYGIEFLDHEGVRRKPEELAVYEGQKGICSFFDDVYEFACREGGEILNVCINEDPITDNLGDYGIVHRGRMAALMDTVTVKCILTENFQSMPAKYCEYRTISKAFVDSVPFYIYGNKCAVMLFNVGMAAKIVVYRSRHMAEAYRRQFFSMWDKATVLSMPNREEAMLEFHKCQELLEKKYSDAPMQKKKCRLPRVKKEKKFK